MYARVSRGVVTDTELQIAQFVLPRHGFGVTNETVEARTLRAFKEELSPVHVSREKITYTVKQRANWYAHIVVSNGILRGRKKLALLSCLWDVRIYRC